MPASPTFRLNGGAPCVKASVGPGDPVTAELDDTSGVDVAEWFIVTTDETTNISSYAINISGPKRSIAKWKAQGRGTAGIIECRINGGIDKATSKTNPQATTARAKFFVPTENDREVICAGETIESDAKRCDDRERCDVRIHRPRQQGDQRRSVHQRIECMATPHVHRGSAVDDTQPRQTSCVRRVLLRSWRSDLRAMACGACFE